MSVSKLFFSIPLHRHIYDPNFVSGYDRFIVPTQIVEDFPDRKKDETIFVFPFDHSEKDEVKLIETSQANEKPFFPVAVFISIK